MIVAVTFALLAAAAPASAEARGLARFRFTVAPSGKVSKTWSADGVAANTTRPAAPRATRPATTAVLEGDEIIVSDAGGKELRRMKVAAPARPPNARDEHHLWIAGDRIYQASVLRNDWYDGAVVLIVRRAADGRILREHQVQRYTQFFDLARAEILAVDRRGQVILESTWIILD
jgi:hypothetical protein